MEQELQDRVARAAGRESKEELMRVRKEIVDLHGEMVLLENYSALNYTGEPAHFPLPLHRRRLACSCHVVSIINIVKVCCCFCC